MTAIEADFYKGGYIACTHLLVPTLWFGAMSMVSVAESWRTARPRSAMQQVPFFLTRMFFDFRSLCAIAGFPADRVVHTRHSVQLSVCLQCQFLPIEKQQVEYKSDYILSILDGLKHNRMPDQFCS